MVVLARPRNEGDGEVTLEVDDVTEDLLEKPYVELLGDTADSATLRKNLSARVRRRERVSELHLPFSARSLTGSCLSLDFFVSAGEIPRAVWHHVWHADQHCWQRPASTSRRVESRKGAEQHAPASAGYRAPLPSFQHHSALAGFLLCFLHNPTQFLLLFPDLKVACIIFGYFEEETVTLTVCSFVT